MASAASSASSSATPQRVSLFVPEDGPAVARVLRESLLRVFEEVTVRAVRPAAAGRLDRAPHHMASSHLGASAAARSVLEVGGVANVEQAANRGKRFDVCELVAAAAAAAATAATASAGTDEEEEEEAQRFIVAGAGAASADVCGANAELLCSCVVESRSAKTGAAAVGGAVLSSTVSQAGLTRGEDDQEYKQESYPASQIGVLANLFMCSETDGGGGDRSPAPSDAASEVTAGEEYVLSFRVAGRRKGLAEERAKAGLDALIREAVREGVPGADADRAVGLAGVFAVTSGTVRAHVMPDFPAGDLTSPEAVNAWLRFFPIRASASRPLSCASVIVTADPHNLGLRGQHTHFFTPQGSDGSAATDLDAPCMGHYHFDVASSDEGDAAGQASDAIVYEGFLAPCAQLYRFN